MLLNIIRSRAAATVALALVLPSPLHAQSRPRPQRHTQTRAERDLADVARCLVAEDERGTDWGALLDVLARRAASHGMTSAGVARAYCAVHRVPRPSARQARIRALPDANPPPRLAAIYARALNAARSGGPGMCVAEHWGAATGEDYARAMRAGWTRVDCGSTRNAFWTVPAR